jgi:DNA transposition AAA+ family ATPase
VNNSTTSVILRGKYPSPPTSFLKRYLEVIDRDTRRRREVVRLPWVETSVARLVRSICHRTHLYRDIGIIAGRPGTGKTEALRHYAAEVDTTILIEASYNMSAGLLLDELIAHTKAQVRTARNGTRGTQAQRLRAVIEACVGTDYLIIVDEADTLTPANLEHLRRISDLGGVGVVLAGEPRLHGMVRDPDGRFGRIHSRVGFWPPVIRAITEEDCNALVASGHAADKVELTPEVLDAYWQVCEGSTRTLSKLLPNVRDFGLAQGHALSARLVLSVAQQTMGMDTRGRRA